MSSLVLSFSGAMAGTVGFSLLIGMLDDMFRPYPDDMSMWLLYSAPAGAVFGCITGYILNLATKRKDEVVAGVSVISALVLGWLHWMMLSDSLHRMSSLRLAKKAIVYACAQYGPGLLWSLILFGTGLYFIFKSSKAPDKQNRRANNSRGG